MAAYGWGTSASVEAWLLAEGRRFDFYQAVSLLEALCEECLGVGEGAAHAGEAVRFKSTTSLGFPETDIASVEAPRRPGNPFEMTVNFMGLAGALGPLPLPFAEIVFQRAVRGDTAARDFLDIFNHRLVSLMYRVRKRHRIGLGVRSPEVDQAAQHLFALIGLGLPSTRGRLGVSDRSLLYCAGLFAKESRSLAGLVAVLHAHFGVPVRAVGLTGRSYAIEDDDRTAIGPSGKNRRLGRGAVLGRRVWDQQAAFDIEMGPLGLADFHRFLPGGDALGPLVEMVRFYAGETFDFRLRLSLDPAEVPPARLGRGGRVVLGYAAWIGSVRPGQPPRSVVLSGAALASSHTRSSAAVRG
jgi:type VI secretion system protein ImpH